MSTYVYCRSYLLISLCIYIYILDIGIVGKCVLKAPVATSLHFRKERCPLPAQPNNECARSSRIERAVHGSVSLGAVTLECLPEICNILHATHLTHSNIHLKEIPFKMIYIVVIKTIEQTQRMGTSHPMNRSCGCGLR